MNQELYFSPVRKTEEPVWQVNRYRAGPGGRERLSSDASEQWPRGAVRGDRGGPLTGIEGRRWF